MLTEKERHLRKIKKLEREKQEDQELDIKDEQNALDLLEVNLTNKLMMCTRFEEMREKLIGLNGGQPPTNEQYQAEEPEYWKWAIVNKAKMQRSQAETGIHEGVWENIRFLEEDAVINDKYKEYFTALPNNSE